MSTQPDTMRKAFESWVKSAPQYEARTFDHLERDAAGEYEWNVIKGAFEGWQAATALATAAERERLTPKKVMISDARDYLNTNDKACWVIGWNECVEAIRKGEA